MGASRLSLAWVIAALLVAAPNAGAVTLDFEGLQDFEQIQDFYNGGAGSLGSVGPDFDIVFGPYAIGQVDLDAGGSGMFANEPSGDTILAGVSPSYYMDVLPGFTEGISFYYSNSQGSIGLGSVEVWDDFGGTGNLLASTGLLPHTGTGHGDPTGEFFSVWRFVELEFSGTARSVVFGDNGRVAFDDVTLIPEPGAAALFAVGFAIAARSIRRRAHSR